MSYPNTPPPEDPYGQGRQPSGGQPGHQGPPGGYPPPPGGYPYQGGYEQTGGYQAPGSPQGGYGMPPQGGYGPSSATTGQPNAEERQMGLFAHLGGGLLGLLSGGGLSFLVPLIIYLVKKDESPFVRDQAAQALNFQLLVLIGTFVSSLLTVVLIGALLWPVVVVISLVFGILGGMAANRGEWYRYPFNVNWVT